MAQYLLSVHGNGENPYPTEEAMQAAFKAVGEFNDRLQEQGKWVFGCGLMPVETATVVDATGPEVLTTDGPYVEAKEHIGGFWVINVPDLDEALKWAAEGSAACAGAVEVRPMQPEE